MKFKTLALAIVAGGALLSAESVLACSTAAWGAGSPPGGGVVGTPTAGQPNGSPAVKRYSGLCGLSSSAAGQFVQDGTITAADTRLRARFYVFTGTTGGNPVVYKGLNASNAQVFAVTYNATTGAFDFATASGTGSTANGSVVANKWYSVELDWNTTAGNMTANVQGNCGNIAACTALPAVTVTGATGSVEYVQLGWVSGTATGTVQVDNYESRRSTAIGRACRGDANNSASITAGDRTAITNELAGTLQSGQVDCNEDGNISAGDRTCVTNLLAAGASCT